MSRVLGFVVSAVAKNYEAICKDHSVTPRVKRPFERLTLLGRYDWDRFVAYVDPLTGHLRELGVDCLTFQRRLFPELFRRLFPVRVSNSLLTPRVVLKAIDVWLGPYMFRCSTTRFEEPAPGRIRIVIDLLPGLAGGRAFFEHCVAGFVAQLEMLGCDESVLEAVTVDSRGCDVTFFFGKTVTPASVAQGTGPSRENFRFWLADFEEKALENGDPEAVQHLVGAARALGAERPAAVDGLTAISSRLQLAASKGWATPEGLAHREAARTLAKALRARFD